MSLTEEEEELLEAALEKDVPKVRKLLDSGVSPNIKLSYNEYTPMHFAVHRPGSAELVTLLLGAGAHVDPLDKDHHSPLHDTKDPEVAELLLKAGAQVDRLTHDGETVLHRIANFHEANLRPPPEEDSDDDDEEDDNDGNDNGDKKKKVDVSDALNKMSIVQDSIVGTESEQDANNDNNDNGGDKYSPKKHYIPSWDGESKQVECAKLLLEAGEKSGGLDINHKDKAGMTALHVAALGGGSTMIKLFLAHGAEVNGDSAGGTTITPLHRAAVPGYVECARALIAVPSVALDRTDVNGDTALHWAARAGHRRFSRVLLRAGADPRAANRRAHTPAHVAKQHGHTKLTAILTKHAA